MEETARKLEAYYQAIVEQAAGGIFLANLDGRFLVVNRRWCEMLGYTERELLGMTLLDITFPEDVEQSVRYLESARTNLRPFLIEKRYRRKDGQPLWLGVSVSAVTDVDGHPEAVTGLAVDISDRKLEEARRAFLLRLSSQLAPLSSADDIIRTTVDAVGEFLGVHRCYFVECKPSDDRVVVSRNWVRDDALSLSGERSLSASGGIAWWQQYSSGDVAVTDVLQDPSTSARVDRYVPYGVRAYAIQPFRRDGDWNAVLAVTENTPRAWAPHDLTLLSEVVVRVWPQVERARAEEELHALRIRTEQRLRLHETMMARTPDLVYTFDLEHRFTYANRALLEMWGIEWDKAAGRTCLELGYPDWHARMHDEEIEEVKRTRQMIRGEVPFHGTSGRRMYDYIFSPVFDAEGAVESIAGTARDVTERHAWEEALRRQTGRRQLLGDAVTALLTSDDQTRMIREVFASVSVHLPIDSCVHYRVDEGGGSLTLQSAIGIADEMHEAVRHIAMGEATSGQVAQDGRVRIVNAVQQLNDSALAGTFSGEVRAYACFPLVAEGQTLGTLGFGSTMRDEFDEDEIELLRTVSRYVTVAMERLRLISELRNADRKKDDFIALLAHELRNPLAPLRNGLQVLRLAGDNTEAMDRARDMMERQLGHMVRLIEDLLDVSRISLNKLDLRREQVALSDVVMHAVESARPAVEAAGHELAVSLPPSPVLLNADLTRMAQVFSNLLTNSAKYTEAGGCIRLTAWREGDDAVVAVSDNGIGMPPEFLPSVFDMFSQVDRTIEHKAGGLGIGLALVKGLVSMHGGTVSAHSEGLGRGSTFTVRLPVEREAIRPTPFPGTGNGASPLVRSRRRILVVDDNLDSAESMVRLLELLGNEVHAAHDGLAAVEKAEVVKPDLVLMDIGMPKLNGYEATRMIRDRMPAHPMLIVALTGWGQEQDRARSRAAGCDRHLVKPISPDDLQALLDELDAGTGELAVPSP